MRVRSGQVRGSGDRGPAQRKPWLSPHPPRIPFPSVFAPAPRCAQVSPPPTPGTAVGCLSKVNRSGGTDTRLATGEVLVRAVKDAQEAKTQRRASLAFPRRAS